MIIITTIAIIIGIMMIIMMIMMIMVRAITIIITTLARQGLWVRRHHDSQSEKQVTQPDIRCTRIVISTTRAPNLLETVLNMSKCKFG